MFDFVAQWTRNRTLAAVAYYNLLIAAISCVPVMATGLMAWHWQLEGQRLKGILLDHLVLAVVSSSLIWLVTAIQLLKTGEIQLAIHDVVAFADGNVVAAIAIGLELCSPWRVPQRREWTRIDGCEVTGHRPSAPCLAVFETGICCVMELCLGMLAVLVHVLDDLDIGDRDQSVEDHLVQRLAAGAECFRRCRRSAPGWARRTKS